MSSFKRPALSISYLESLPIQIQPLCDRDRMTVEHALLDMAPEWSVELQGICNQEASLIVLPEDGDDAMGPSFAISRESYGLRLDQVHWDELTEIGVYASMNDLLDAMSIQLGVWSRSPLRPSRTIH